MIGVNYDDLDGSHVDQKIFYNFFKDYIEPEIHRREKREDWSKNTKIYQFQVIMHVGKKDEIRLNSEVKIKAKGKINKSVKKDDVIDINDLVSIEELRPLEQDEDAGHISGIFIRDSWFLSFDFTRNKARKRRALATAREFLSSARAALDLSNYRAFHENLFEAMEKAIIATLLFIPDPRFLNAKKHSFWQSNINMWKDSSIIDEQYVKLFNELSDDRNKARYSYEEFIIVPEKAQKMFSQANDFISKLK